MGNSESGLTSALLLDDREFTSSVPSVILASDFSFE